MCDDDEQWGSMNRVFIVVVHELGMEGLLGLHNVARHSYLFMACVEWLNIISFYLCSLLLMLFYEISPCYSSLSRILSTPSRFDRFSSDTMLVSNSTR